MSLTTPATAAHTAPPMQNVATTANAVQTSNDIAAANVAGLDFADPDTVLSFFGAQMSSAQGNVNAMMETQEQRSQVQQKVQDLTAQMTQYEQSGVKPGDAGWNDFVQTASQLKSYMTDGSDASTKINAMLDAATTSPGTMTTSTTANADDVRKLQATPGVVVQYVAPGIWAVQTPTPPSGITNDQVKSLDAQLKSVTDGMTSDTTLQMVRVQQGVEQCSQIMNECTNVMKKISDAQENAISNIK